MNKYERNIESMDDFMFKEDERDSLDKKPRYCGFESEEEVYITDED